jgi:ATP-binding cassette subfamily B multidrug efflux pump
MLLGRPMGFFSDHQAGELSVKATEDISRLQPVFAGLLAPSYQNILVIGGCFFFMARISTIAAAVALVLMVLPLPFVVLSGRRIQKLSAESTAEHARANALLEESIIGIREIKVFGREDAFVASYGASQQKAYRSELLAARNHVRINQSISLLLSVLMLSIFAVGTSGRGLTGWTLGNVIAFYFYAYTAVMAAVGVGKVYLTHQGISGALEKTYLLMGDNAARRPDRQTRSAPQCGLIEFRDVSFKYVIGHPVLRDVSFRIEPGSTILLVGSSGSGKTTLVNLMVGLYEPDSGCITLDDQPLTAIDRSSLLRTFGYVGQDPILFHGTLKENIFFSALPVGQERLHQVLHTACLEEVIEELPEGLSTIVGERGFTLSGGQRARVAIARAILYRPAILVLDEANAMLGQDIERRLWDRLLEDRRGLTTIILSHHHENLPEGYLEMHLKNGNVSQIADPLTREA